MSERTSEAATAISAGSQDDVIGLVEAHARHVATQLPRGQVGTQAAASFLAAVPGAIRLRLADLTGTACAIVEAFVAHGLLPVLPNPKVSRAIPRLLAPLTPLLEARSERVWTLWLTALQDPHSPLVARLRETTPAAALLVRTPAPSARVRTLRELTDERDGLAAQVAALEAVLVGLEAQLAERTGERDGAVTAMTAVTDERAELREQLRLAEVARISAENTAHTLAETLARTQEDHRQQLADDETAVPAELERLAEFYEAQLREAEERAAEAERRAQSTADLADLQAFLRASIQGQEQLTLFALRRTHR